MLAMQLGAAAELDADDDPPTPSSDELAHAERPGIAAQILGLSAVRRSGLSPAERQLLTHLVGTFPAATHDHRREVLSLAECLRFAGC